MTLEIVLVAGAGLAVASAVVLVLVWRRRAAREARILADERAAAASLLRETSERAQAIIREAEGVRDELRVRITQGAEEIVGRLFAAYEKEIQTALAEVRQRMTAAAETEIQQMRTRLARAEQAAKRDLKARVVAVLPRVIAQVAGRSLPVEIHDEIVAHAVEEAAAAGFFQHGDDQA